MTMTNAWSRVASAVTPEQQAQIAAEAGKALENLSAREVRDHALLLTRAQAAVSAAAARLGLPLTTEQQQTVTAQVASQLGGLGFLNDLVYDRPGASEIAVQTDGTVWVMEAGRMAFSRLPARPAQEEVWRAVEALLAPLGRSLSEATPSVDAKLPRDPGRNFSGARLKIIHPAIAPGPGQVAGSTGYPSINVRKYEARPVRPEQIVRWGMAPEAVVENLVQAVSRAARVLVVGGTASGKTTLLCALAAGIPGEARVVKVEDPEEIWLDPAAHPQVVTLERRPAPPGSSVPEYSVADGVDDALRMSPRWLVVGEVRRGDAALALFRAQMSDHPGLSTFHADGPEKAVHRLAVIMFADAQVAMAAAKEIFVEAVDLVVQVGWRNDVRVIVGVWETEPELRGGNVRFRTLYQHGQEQMAAFTRRG